MKLHTSIIVVKGLCYLVIGIFTPWAAALAQWSNSGEWPAKIIWLGVILPASAIGGANGLLSFLSNSYGNYVKERTDFETSRFVKPTQALKP